MNEKLLHKGGDWSRTAAAAVALLVAGRFTYVAVTAAMAKSAMPSGTEPSTHPPRGPERSARPIATTTPAPLAPAGTPIRTTAMITVGADRSDVFIDDTNVGKSPFVGDISCRTGEVVHIRVVPPQGAALEAERPCTKGTLKVESVP